MHSSELNFKFKFYCMWTSCFTFTLGPIHIRRGCYVCSETPSKSVFIEVHSSHSQFQDTPIYVTALAGHGLSPICLLRRNLPQTWLALIVLSSRSLLLSLLPQALTGFLWDRLSCNQDVMTYLTSITRAQPNWSFL